MRVLGAEILDVELGADRPPDDEDDVPFGFDTPTT